MTCGKKCTDANARNEQESRVQLMAHPHPMEFMPAIHARERAKHHVQQQVLPAKHDEHKRRDCQAEANANC